MVLIKRAKLKVMIIGNLTAILTYQRALVPIVAAVGDKYIPVGLSTDVSRGFALGRPVMNEIEGLCGGAEMNVRGIKAKDRIVAVVFEPAAA
jgi:hypothetical protein